MTDRVATASSSLAVRRLSFPSRMHLYLILRLVKLYTFPSPPVSCATSGSLFGEWHFEDAALISSFTSDIGGRTLAVASSMTMDALSSFASSATLPAFALPHQSFQKSSLVGRHPAPVSRRRTHAVVCASERHGRVRHGLARLCASNLDRLLTRENAASVARPIRECYHLWDTRPLVFAIGDERADCDIAPFGDSRARSPGRLIELTVACALRARRSRVLVALRVGQIQQARG